ncbi:MAG TPA: MBL fold metallo-hydrolase [Rhodocyclaceae bacterium]|jgi:glyoxylase-like metal-dependent hydrolase (beta-lactamase superfamily II)|nr:MBL fold metallo-hydrolase [Rhodocyclaceae bacterium]
MKFQIVPVTRFQQNCSVIWCEETKKAAVVDPGGDLQNILAVVAAKGLTVEKILVTHGHLDHCGQAATLAAQLGVQIEGPHEDERFWLEKLGPEQGQFFGLEPGVPFEPNRWLKEGDTVTVGNETLQVFHCPGHTPGHVVFYNPKEELAIVGDVLFKGAMGRTDLPMGNNADLLNAIRTKLLTLPDDVEFIPGHGPMSTIGDEKEHNPFVSHKKFG